MVLLDKVRYLVEKINQRKRVRLITGRCGKEEKRGGGLALFLGEGVFVVRPVSNGQIL